MKLLAQLGVILMMFCGVFARAEQETKSPQMTCSVCGARMFSSDPKDVDADSFDTFPKTFHHYGIENHAEAYLVCVYEVEGTGGPKNEAQIKATVVDRIKGEKEVGERIDFRRVNEESLERLVRMRGGLYYVFLDEDDDGNVAVDGQDPLALREYSDELNELVQRHKGLTVDLPGNTVFTPLYVHFGFVDFTKPPLLSARIDLEKPVFVEGGDLKLTGRIEKRGDELFADLYGSTGAQGGGHEGKITLEEPFGASYGAASGGFMPIWFAVSTNSDSESIVLKLKDFYRVRGQSSGELNPR